MQTYTHLVAGTCAAAALLPHDLAVQAAFVTASIARPGHGSNVRVRSPGRTTATAQAAAMVTRR